jgi:hypothetical protein
MGNSGLKIINFRLWAIQGVVLWPWHTGIEKFPPWPDGKRL